MGNRIIAVADFKTRRAAIDEEAGDLLLRAARCFLLAGGDEDNDEIGDIGMRNEMLGAVDDPVVAIGFGKTFHAAHVGTGVRLGHGKRIEFLALDGRDQVFLALLVVAGHENAGGAAKKHGQAHRAPAKLALDERKGLVIEPGATHFLRHVAGEEAEILALLRNLLAELLRHDAGAFHLVLMRIDLGLDEAANGIDDHLLFFGQCEIHDVFPLILVLGYPPLLPSGEKVARRAG